MSLTRIVARNAFWNWTGLIVQLLAGFVVSPFLVNQMGDARYGLWLLIASLSSYFGLLDLGLRGSVGRNVAFYRAKQDPRNVNVMYSTSMAILLAAGVIALLATLGLLSFFLRLFPDIPPEQIAPARLSLLIIGVTLGFSLPMNTYDALLWGFQRFDLINAIDIVAVSIRTALTFYYIGQGDGLVALAWITLISTAAQTGIKAIAVHWIEPGLRLSPRSVTRSGASQLFNYGAWSFVNSISRLLTSQFSTLIIGARLGISTVTPYSIASRLLNYGAQLVSSTAGVLTPVATGFHAGDQADKQRRLYLDGGKFGLAFALFFTINFLLLGRPLIRVWMGPSQEYTASLLYILALGETLPMGQLITGGIMQGMGRPRLLAMINMADGLAVVVALLLLSGPFKLVGVCVALAASGFLFRGVIMAVCGARLVGVPLRRYVTQSVLPAVAAAIPPAAGLAALVAWRSPRGWAELFLYGGLFTVAYLASLIPLVGLDLVRVRLVALNKRFLNTGNGV